MVKIVFSFDVLYLFNKFSGGQK